MSLGHGSSVVRDGLLVHLDAANPKSYPGSGSSCFDLSKNNNTGFLVNETAYTTSPQPTFTFDGVNDYISLTSTSRRLSWAPVGTTGHQTITLELWVKTTDTSGYIISKPWNGSGGYNYRITHDSFFTQLAAAHTSSFTSVATNTWTHIVAIANTTQKAVYVNGVLASAFTNHTETSDTPASGDANLPLCLMTLYPYGASAWSQPTHAINGSLSVFRFYNRQLTEDEIKQNFEALRGRYGI